MHRTEGSNNVGNLYAEGPPGTTVTASAMNAIQEEIANTIEGAGLQLKSAATDIDHNQLLQAIQQLTNAGYDAVISTQDQFNNIFHLKRSSPIFRFLISLWSVVRCHI